MRGIIAGIAALLLAGPALAFTGRIINLGDAQISTAVTNQVITSSVNAQSVAIAYVDRLEGVSAVTFQANFAYGAGGTSVVADLETSLDQGFSWVIVCRVAFATASASKVATVSGLTPRTTAAAVATPSDNACNDGVIGDRLRVRITSVGVYSGNTTISTRAALR